MRPGITNTRKRKHGKRGTKEYEHTNNIQLTTTMEIGKAKQENRKAIKQSIKEPRTQENKRARIAFECNRQA